MKILQKILYRIKMQKCNHHWQGYVMNGSGGSHVWCDKCGFDHYGCYEDRITQEAITDIKRENNND